MYHFTTVNGAEYTIHNGRITRESTVPITDRNGGAGVIDRIVNEPFLFTFRGVPTSRPSLGEKFRFTLKRGDLPIETGHVNFVSNGGYCAGCDTYGDLMGCERTPQRPSIDAVRAAAQ